MQVFWSAGLHSVGLHVDPSRSGGSLTFEPGPGERGQCKRVGPARGEKGGQGRAEVWDCHLMEFRNCPYRASRCASFHFIWPQRLGSDSRDSPRRCTKSPLLLEAVQQAILIPIPTTRTLSSLAHRIACTSGHCAGHLPQLIYPSLLESYRVNSISSKLVQDSWSRTV